MKNYERFIALMMLFCLLFTITVAMISVDKLRKENKRLLQVIDKHHAGYYRMLVDRDTWIGELLTEKNQQVLTINELDKQIIRWKEYQLEVQNYQRKVDEYLEKIKCNCENCPNK